MRKGNLLGMYRALHLLMDKVKILSLLTPSVRISEEAKKTQSESSGEDGSTITGGSKSGSGGRSSSEYKAGDEGSAKVPVPAPSPCVCAGCLEEEEEDEGSGRRVDPSGGEGGVQEEEGREQRGI